MLIWVSHSCTRKRDLGPSLSFDPLTFGWCFACCSWLHPSFLCPITVYSWLAGSPSPLLHSSAPLTSLVGTVPCSVYLQLWFWWEPGCSSRNIVIYEAVLMNASEVPGRDVPRSSCPTPSSYSSVCLGIGHHLGPVWSLSLAFSLPLHSP